MMSLYKLARELEETARQSAAMIDGIAEALDLLGNINLSFEQRQRLASGMIINALQGQDRIEQRCHGLASAARHMAALPPDAADDEVWANLTLDELRVPTLSGIAVTPSTGDVELF